MKRKIPIQKILAGYKPIKGFVLSVLFLTMISGCKKDALPVQNTVQENGSTIKFVLNDNSNFSIVYAGLTKVGIQDTLAKPGAYTFIAPSNSAFGLVNITEPLQGFSFQFYTPSQLQNIMRYSVLQEKIVFKNIPLTENKPYKTSTGGNIYVSKYLNGSDTIITVNGQKLTSIDNVASNGLIQVLSQVINPEIYHNAVDYIHGDTTLTLFSAALQRAKLDVSLLAGNDAYTILAPSNLAFNQSAKLGLNLGVSTMDSILIADPAKLTAFLKYHIIQGRYFEGDLYNYASSDPSGITTLGGEKVIIGGFAAGFHAITFLGNGDNGISSAIAVPLSYNPTINNADIPCGNGVIHIINRVLIP